MNRLLTVGILLLLCISCERNEMIPPYAGKLKKTLHYSSSTEDEPYSFIEYFYDDKGQLVKEVFRWKPNYMFAYHIYEYSEEARLLKKRRQSIEGSSVRPFFKIIYDKYDYYSDNKQIEHEYKDDILTDSTVFIYDGDNLLGEYHYDVEKNSSWNITYEYDGNNNLIRKTEPGGLYSGGTYTTYQYIGSTLDKVYNHAMDGSILVENTYSYRRSGNDEIVEIHYKDPSGEFLSNKKLYRAGKLIEDIAYDSAFNYSERSCSRYKYY